MADTRELLLKIDGFIRKYYKNRLIKGVLLTTALITGWIILLTIAEYFGQFGRGIRSAFFWLWIGITTFTSIYYIVIPIMKLLRIGAIITHSEAAVIIGNHFPDIKDKLLNTLQLAGIVSSETHSNLLTAAIEQKTLQLKPIPFTSAINLKNNIRYLRYALPPVIIISLILLISPGIITEPTKRIIRYDREFKKQAPFTYQFKNKNLTTEQFSDFELNVAINGSRLPDEVDIIVDNNSYRMHKIGKTNFRYTFKNLRNSLTFHFSAGGFESDEFSIQVIPKPKIVNFDVDLIYPSYIKKSNEKYSNTGNLRVPSGTEIKWTFHTENVNLFSMLFNNHDPLIGSRSDETYIFSGKFFKPQQYTIKAGAGRQFIVQADSISYQLDVVPDAFPTIDMEEVQDTQYNKIRYLSGFASDDYGINRITFNYKCVKSDDPEKLKNGIHIININSEGTETQKTFFQVFDLGSMKPNPGDEFEYYFEVWDNDGINGSKSTRSKINLYKSETREEYSRQKEENSREMKRDLAEALQESKNIQQELKKMQEKLAGKKEMSWEDKKRMEDLLKRQKNLEQRMEEIRRNHEMDIQRQQDFSNPDPELLRKQQELQKIMKDIFDDEMKELLRQFEELIQKNDKEMLRENMEQMQVQDKEVQKELDRMLEMYKKLELEEKKQGVIDKLEDLKKQQEQLAEESMKQDANAEEIKKKQEELNKKFDELQRELNDIEKKNNELENPESLENTEQEEQDVKNEQEQSRQQLSKGNKKEAAKSQKKAAEKMKQMKEKLEKDMKKKEQESAEEDYNSLRMILENLLKLSFEQEEIMEELRSVNGYNPKYIQLSQKQKRIKEHAQLIEDSLFFLSKRQVRIAPVINKEIIQINSNIEKALEDLADRNIYTARSRQQYVMTHVNNLAIMLSEILKNMQQQMQQQGKQQGQGQCNNPGGNNPKKGKGGKSGQNGRGKDLKSLRQMQDELAKQIEQMKKGMKPGQSQSPGQNGMPNSKQFAEAAALQAAIRQKLRMLSKQIGKEGGTQLQKQLEQIQQLMDQNERELYNRNLTPEMLKRQQEIQIKLLESEKARQEQETDNERKAKSGSDNTEHIKKAIEDYKKRKLNDEELLISVPPGLTPYYREKTRIFMEKK